MKYTDIKGINASRMMMGCMRIAEKPLPQTEKLIVEAVRSGVNAFDLADVYAKGDCEKVFGVAVKDLKLNREEYIVQTKCGIRYAEFGKYYDFSREHIIASAENSLQRLKTEYIDVLLLHRPDTLVEPEEVASAFAKLHAAGKVRAFGVSNASAMQIEAFQRCGVNIAVNQMQFSLGHTLLVDAGVNVNTTKDEAVTRAGDVLEYCRMNGVTLQAWSPLQFGFFGGVFIGNENFPALNAELDRLAEKYHCTPSAIACAWILRHPANMQVITGTTSPERMRELCVAADIELTREEWYALYTATGKTVA
jgi:predicted oxidoreductase